MSPDPSVRPLVRTAVAFTVLALAACGASTPSASNPTASSSSTTAKAQAPCTVAAAMAPISAKFNTAIPKSLFLRPPT